jgi:hypothetical protein
MCGEEQTLSTVPWLIWEKQEGEEFEVPVVNDVQACEWCVTCAGVCEAMDHYADHRDVSGYSELYSPDRLTTWSFCPLHERECLEQIVEQAVEGGLTLSTILELIEASSYPPAGTDEAQLMKDHARRLLPPLSVRRGRINTGLTG